MIGIHTKKRCCCEEGKNFVVECFPQICEDGTGGGWRNFFGYAAAERAGQLRFYTRISEQEVERLRQVGWPDRPFVWWDHELSSPQNGGGGQLWELRPGPENINNHPDLLFANDEPSLPSDPRAMGLEPPPNSFVFFDKDGNEIRDDGVFLEVYLATNFDLGRNIAGDDGFTDRPKRITGSQYDDFLNTTISGPFDWEFTLVDLNDVTVSIDPETGEVTGSTGGAGYPMPNVPPSIAPKIQRVSHLGHYLFALSERNFEGFKQGTGIDQNGEITVADVGGFQPPFDNDTPINICLWKRWILYCHPQAGMRQLKFAATFDLFNADRQYDFANASYPNAPGCSESYDTAQTGFADGTFNCDRVLSVASRQWPQEMHVAQNYFPLIAGNEFALVPNAPYQWPRPDGSVPEFPDNLRNRVPGTTGTGTGPNSQCADPDTNCSKQWGLIGNIVSQKLPFNKETTQTKVLGNTISEMLNNDPFGILISYQSGRITGSGAGTLDHFDNETDQTENLSQPRRFGWPSRFTGTVSAAFNVCSQSDFAKCCGAGVGEGILTQFDQPGTESSGLKFRMCDLLNGTMKSDSHTDRSVDAGPVVHMDAREFVPVAYLHPGINMSGFWSNCGGAGLTPNFRQGDFSQFIKTNGFFRVRHSPLCVLNYIQDENEPEGCTDAPCGLGTQCDILGCLTPSGCTCACHPDKICGEGAGFAQNLNVNADATCPSPAAYSPSIRGVFSKGLEPSTTYGTVDF